MEVAVALVEGPCGGSLGFSGPDFDQAPGEPRSTLFGNACCGDSTVE